MDLINLTYLKYFLVFVIGVIVGRFSMALQYAIMEKKAEKKVARQKPKTQRQMPKN